VTLEVSLQHPTYLLAHKPAAVQQLRGNYRLGRIRGLLLKNYNYHEAIWGRTGVGKSECSISSALNIDALIAKLFNRPVEDWTQDPEQWVRNHVFFNLMLVFKAEKNIPKGAAGYVFIVDEGAVELSNKRGNTVFAQLFAMLGTTHRLKRSVILINLPNIQMLNLDQRRLLNGILWLHDENRGVGEYQKIQEAPNGDIYCTPDPAPPYYWKNPWFFDPWTGSKYRRGLRNFRFAPMPDDHPIVVAYKKVKEESHGDLEENIEEKLENLEELSHSFVKGSMYEKSPEAALERKALESVNPDT
jgi:hypothetical protein